MQFGDLADFFSLNYNIKRNCGCDCHLQLCYIFVASYILEQPQGCDVLHEL